MAYRRTWVARVMRHEKITTTLQLYTRRTDDEGRILAALTDEPDDGDGSQRRRLLVPGVLLMGLLCWWAILGLNQWPLPCQGSALPLS
jgi:hypothetical protein